MRKWTHAFDFKGAIKRGGAFDKDAKLLSKGPSKRKFRSMLFSVKIVLRW